MSYYIKNNNSNYLYSFLDSVLDDLYYQDLNPKRKSNIIKEEDHILIQIEAAGLNKKDIDIQVKENILHVSYENKIKDDTKYSQQQISFGSFENKYKLQNDMDSKNVSATMNNGLLNIKIPKIKNKTSSRIKIT
jgi:HSP20 family protein